MSDLFINSLVHWPPALVEVLILHDDPPSRGAQNVRNVAFSFCLLLQPHPLTQ